MSTARKRAAQAISAQYVVVQTSPAMGRPIDPAFDLRELLISFGDWGYVALYHHDKAMDAILILAFRHQREAGYG